MCTLSGRGGSPQLQIFRTIVQNDLKSVRKVAKTIKIWWEMSSNCEFFSLDYIIIILFEHLKRFVLVATASTMKIWGNFSSFSFNWFGLKSDQVELVDFEYRLNEGESMKSSSPTKIQPNFRTYSCAAGNLYFETVERYRFYFYVAAWSVTDSGRQAREHMVPASYMKH